MNVILLEDGDFPSGPTHARVSGRRARHLVDVLGAQPGRELRVGVLGGRLGTGRVLSVDGHEVHMQVSLDRDPPAPLPLTLLLALPRPKSLKKALQAAFCMGVKRVFLMQAWHVEKSFWGSPVLRPEALREQMLLALEQAGDTVLPTVETRRRLKPFVEDEVPSIAAGSLALLGHPEADAPCPRGRGGAVTLAIGPEGGFTAYEVGLFRARGFQAVSLGARRLRVEAAVAALLGRLF